MSGSARTGSGRSGKPYFLGPASGLFHLCAVSQLVFLEEFQRFLHFFLRGMPFGEVAQIRSGEPVGILAQMSKQRVGEFVSGTGVEHVSDRVFDIAPHFEGGKQMFSADGHGTVEHGIDKSQSHHLCLGPAGQCAQRRAASSTR